jgi:hypothetical protein
VVVAWFVLAAVLLRTADWLERLIALPPLFSDAMAVLLVVGLVLGIALAWRMPRIGTMTGGTGDGGPADS